MSGLEEEEEEGDEQCILCARDRPRGPRRPFPLEKVPFHDGSTELVAASSSKWSAEPEETGSTRPTLSSMKTASWVASIGLGTWSGWLADQGRGGAGAGAGLGPPWSKEVEPEASPPPDGRDGPDPPPLRMDRSSLERRALRSETWFPSNPVRHAVRVGSWVCFRILRVVSCPRSSMLHSSRSC